MTDVLADLTTRLDSFVRHQLHDPDAHVADVRTTSGHAGFSYTFVLHSSGGATPHFLRLPPEGVRQVGTADVLRQVVALRALDATRAPHAKVAWSGADTTWFGRPYFITDGIDGVTLDTDERVQALDADALTSVAQQAVRALVEMRKVPWHQTCGYLLPGADLREQVSHWDRFYERAADRNTLLADAPRVREALLASVPERAHIGLCHGDYQFGNLMYRGGELTAVIDWELCSVGPTLRDLGWLLSFNDAPAWGPAPRPMASRLDTGMLMAHWPDELPTGGLDWFRAFALYEYAVISGFNLMLHRRGKRPDQTWEWRSSSAPANLSRAAELLASARTNTA